jgi:hypothetical protein
MAQMQAMGGMGAMGAMGGMGMPNAAPAGGGNNKRKSAGGGRKTAGGGRQAPSAAMTPYMGGGAMMAMGGGAMVPAEPPAAEQPRGDMSFDDRAAISNGISRLKAHDLNKVMEILRDGMPGLQSSDGGEVEIDINALDNATLWRLKDYIDNCLGPKQRKPPTKKKAGASFAANLDTAAARTNQQLESVRAARSALGAGDGGTSGGDFGGDDDWASDGDSDNGFGGGGGGVGGGAMWEGFSQTKASMEQERRASQQRERQQAQAAREETERARRAAQQKDREAQRQRDEQRRTEREARERERGGVDMMAQQNAMAAYTQGGDDDWDDALDEYGMSGFV